MDYLTVKEAARKLKRRKEWIYYLLQQNDPRLVFIRPGTEYLISADSVASFKHRPRGNPTWQTATQDRPRRSAKARIG